ncbi:MAG: peptidyl-prolyl cis-trans isomerase [Kiritimatiellia bacterium]
MRTARRACVVAAFLCGAAAAVEVDGIAARVGEDAILRSDVVAEMMRSGERDGAQFANYLNDMIDRRLVIRAAGSAKMTMQEWVIENRVREIVDRSFGGDRNRLLETLSRQKLSYPEWYARTKEDMIVGAMRWNMVDKHVTASPEAMRKEYDEHRDRYVKDHLVSVSVILLKPEEKSRRDAVSAELKTKTFEELGGQKYENVKATDVFKPEIVEEIERMPKGTVSHWIELDGWSFLLRKDGETAGKALSFDEAYDAIEAAVKEQEAKRLYSEWIERLRAETYIKVF